jgi:hypothetical protein
MARLFDDAASQYLHIASAVKTATPLTMACWFYSDDIAAYQVLMSLKHNGSATGFNTFFLAAVGSVVGDPIRAFTGAAAAFSFADTTTGYSANTWHHACAVFAASNDRRAFIDGGSKGTENTARVPAGINETLIAKAGSTGLAQYMSGRIAEVAIWNVALSDAEVALLAKGFSPLFIQPHNLVAYYPLIRDDDNDWIGGFNLTAVNAPTVGTHPPQIVHPTIETASVTGLLILEPTEIYGQGIVNNVFFLNPVYGLGTVFAPSVKQIITFRDQRPTLATPGLAEYKVRIKNQDGEPVAEFDNWLSLNFTHKVNHRGSCRFEINGADSRIQYLIPNSDNLDNQIEVWRRNPIIGLDWYIEWEGFLRTHNDLYEQNDNNKFVAFGFSYLDLARRAEIKWLAGTSQADKSGVGETVMKEYVSQNIGSAALLASGRSRDHVYSGLSIQADGGAGDSWDGAMSDQNLLDVLQKIAIATSVDFDIIGIGAALFQFVTYDGQRNDRTKGNTDGNSPVIFSLGFGNMVVPVLSRNRTEEVTTAYALGKGTDSARQSAVATSLAALDSPWNDIEKTGGASNTSGDDLDSAAEEIIAASAEKIAFNFQVLQTRSTYYGFHYWWGDLVTARYKAEEFDKKITEANITVSPNSNGEQITVTFADN